MPARARYWSSLIGPRAAEVDDRELLAVPVEGVDILVTSKKADGKTLENLAKWPESRGVFLRKITRGATATDIPILPATQINRGDILTLVGRTQDTAAATKALGYADRPTDVTDVAFVGGAIAIGALIGALVYNVGDVPLTLSTSGGALISGLFFGWLRSVQPDLRAHPVTGGVVHEFGRPQRVHRRRRHLVRAGLRGRPAATRIQPVSLGHCRDDRAPDLGDVCRKVSVFKFHPAILLGCCSGARTTTASLGMINDRAKSQIPGLGYTVTYAVGNTLLTIWGMVLVILMT